MLSALAIAATLRVFGSLGAEMQLTPASTSSPLNPRNVAAMPHQTNVADAAVFVNASSRDNRWKLRAKVRAEASDRAADRGELGEAFVQFAATEWLDVTAGRVIEKWGTGYGWTPTAFVGPSRDATDPNDRRSAYRGRDMVRADVFVKGSTVSVYGLADRGIAARGYRLVRGTDVSVVYRRENAANAGGISVSRVFGEGLELHAELARAAQTRAVVGGQYTFPSHVNVVLEIYHGTDGLTAREWDEFRDSVDDDLQRANARYALLRMGRTYAFARVSRPFGKVETELITIMNVRDGSTLVRAALTYKMRPNISLYAMGTELFGRSESEMAYLQVERVTTAGARLYF